MRTNTLIKLKALLDLASLGLVIYIALQIFETLDNWLDTKEPGFTPTDVTLVIQASNVDTIYRVEGQCLITRLKE